MPSNGLLRLLVLVFVAATFSAGHMTGTNAADGSADAAFSGRWFSTDSPWNQPIPDDASTLSGSDGFLAAFRQIGGRINVNREIWTPAVVYADESVSRCDMQLGPWALERAPMSPALRTMAAYFARRGDTDSSFCIYSSVDRAFYNFWAVRMRMTARGDAVEAGASAVFPLDGPGWWDNAKEPWAGRSSGASYCGGLVRHIDLEGGSIDHALALGWPAELIRGPKVPSAFVYPAGTTDGKGTDTTRAVPMGARLQLDPALDDDALRSLGLREADLTLAHALQRYGGYVTDSSSVMAIYVESSPSASNPLVASLRGRWPQSIAGHIRFISPPTATRLDDRFSVGNPSFKPPEPGSPPARECLVD